MPGLRKTALNSLHHELKAKMIDFAGWEMPVWYSSIIEEHRSVRSSRGMFDVSDMGRIRIEGGQAGEFLDRVLTKPVAQLGLGSSKVCLMCLENGGILDDLLVYHWGSNCYLIVWNAANTESKIDWLSHWSVEYPDVTIKDISNDTAMVAIQGPEVTDLKILKGVVQLPRFGSMETEIENVKGFVARTGYTGEDGFEVITDAADAEKLWKLLLHNGVTPCGLGARDSLRLEAGMMLYGQDMDTNTNPYVAGLGWLVDLNDGDFVGKHALSIAFRNGIRHKLIGFEMLGREIARQGYKILKDGCEVGIVTSGGYAPTLGFGIGLGYVPPELAATGADIEILIRNKPAAARVANKRFYKRGA